MLAGNKLATCVLAFCSILMVGVFMSCRNSVGAAPPYHGGAPCLCADVEGAAPPMFQLMSVQNITIPVLQRSIVSCTTYLYP